MKHSTLYIGENTAVVEFYDVQDHLGVPQSDSTVALTAMINKATGAPVAGITPPIAMPYVPEDALYRCVIAAPLSIVAGGIYEATIKATGSQGFKAEYIETILAKVRQA